MTSTDISRTTAQLAVALGDMWRSEPGNANDGSDAFLRGPYDFRLRLSTEHWKKRGRDRLYIQLALPDELRAHHRGHGDCLISVARHRDPAAIARDIAKRLLPDCKQAYAAAVEHKRDFDAEEGRKAALVHNAVAMLGGREIVHSPGTVRFGSYGEGVNGAVEVRRSDRVKFEVEIPASQAGDLTRVLSELAQQAKAPKRAAPELQPAPTPATSPVVAEPEAKPDAPHAERKVRRARRGKLTPEERKQDRAERVDQLRGALAEAVTELVDDERWESYLRAARNLCTDWSYNNLVLLTQQAAERGFTPTVVKTSGAWKKLGRKPKSGESALYIFEPVRYRISDEQAEAEGADGYDADGKPRHKMCGVIPGPRFDISQTEGDDVTINPAVPVALTGDDPTRSWNVVTRLVEDAGYTVTRGRTPEHGYADPTTRTVCVNSRSDGAQALKTLLHELAHIELGHVEDTGKYRQHRGRMEAEAESVAFIVAGVLGLDTGGYSVPYIARWCKGDAEVLATTAEHVTTTAQRIIGRLHAEAECDLTESTPMLSAA